MSWLKNKVRSWLNNDDYNNKNLGYEPASGEQRLQQTCRGKSDTVDASLTGRPLQLSVFNASGGIVIEARRYDQHGDRDGCKLYVIQNDTDLGEELAKVITIEGLRG